MSSLSHLTVEELRREAAVLHHLLAENLWGAELRPVKLAASQSALVRAFWDEVGWDDSLRAELGPPQVDAGRHIVRDLLADYRRSGSPLAASALPARYRLVLPDTDGVGFAVTDESGPELDPPVIAFSSRTGASGRIGESYLRWATSALVHAVTRDWYLARLESDPPLEELAQAPIPHLAPALRTVSSDVWLRPREREADGGWRHASLRSFEGLWRWLGEVKEVRRLAIEPLPGGSRPLAAPAEALRAATEGWRALDGISPVIGYRIGTLGQAPVIVQLGTPSTISFRARDASPVTAWLAERGWLPSES